MIALRGRLADLTLAERALLLDRRPADEPEVRARVAELLALVRARGDDALLEMARRYDKVDLAAIEVPRARWENALVSLDGSVRSALERAAKNIAAFHAAQMPVELTVDVEPGVRLGRRFGPLGAVGVYAPGGRASYPSSVLMGAVPARVAGVAEVIVCSPPGPDGTPPPAVLAAAALAGATRVFALGGAGAVGAMAYGTATVPRCDAVVGPGNRWVLEAKRQVAGEVRIDSPAGPSELLVLADGSADPDLIAAELIAQAEHDPDAAVALVTTEPALLDAVASALGKRLAGAPRREVIAAALATRGALLVADSLAEAVQFTEFYAPEHLLVLTRNAAVDAERIHTAGTIFLGPGSAVAFGDYMTGGNHVLPTAGSGRSFSGLSALDFLRSWTWQEVSPAGARALSEDTAVLADAEGLPGHAAAARLRADMPGAGGGALVEGR
ncbi:MAG: histidinol dehydrogenase [Gemmatimonadetes bacterium]|nr:histidinol dehydrogenase [Gemmatimonadota bacterium]